MVVGGVMAVGVRVVVVEGDRMVEGDGMVDGVGGGGGC